MPELALVGYATFLVLAIGLRAALHYRDTGTTGIVGIRGRAFSVEWWGGVLFVVAAVGVGLAAPLAELSGRVPAWRGEASTAGYVVGAALTAIGIAGTLWAQLAMGRSWRVGVDPEARTELVAHGPFRWVRNPIYTWMICASVGLVLLAPNWLAVGSLAALLAALEIQVRAVEEPHLLRAHGDAYRRYAAATGRFVPGIGRMT
jgi:protein-S-isoprenylcysteine O-methyltransferase Ste14